MLLRIRDTGQILTEDEFKRSSNTSFPNGVIPASFLDERGIDVVFEGAQPNGEPWQYPIQDGIEQIGNNWHTKYILGPVFETQAEEDEYIANWQLSNTHVSTPKLVASGVFSVTDGLVESIGAAAGLSAVFAIDVGMYWLFFSEPQSDLSYAVYASSSMGQTNITSRSLDYLELCVKDGDTLIDPNEFSVNIVRSV